LHPVGVIKDKNADKTTSGPSSPRQKRKSFLDYTKVSLRYFFGIIPTTIFNEYQAFYPCSSNFKSIEGMCRKAIPHQFYPSMKEGMSLGDTSHH
jgi:hypothetical protein